MRRQWLVLVRGFRQWIVEAATPAQAIAECARGSNREVSHLMIAYPLT